MRRYGIIGTGALGGFYGCRLCQSGIETHFLLRSDYEWVKVHGLNLESPLGDISLTTVNAYDACEAMPPCDVVVVALKSTQNKSLPHLLPAVLKPGGTVAVLQNGLGIEEEVARIVGPEAVIGGLCFLCSNKVGPGHIRHLDYGQITLGEYWENAAGGQISLRLEQIAADFRQAQLPITLTPNLRLARWQKLIWNIPFNGLSVVLNAQTDQLVNNPSTRKLVITLMEEVAAAAAAYHCVIKPEFIEHMLTLTAKMHPYRTSMKIDADLQRPMEIEAMFYNPLQAAAAVGVPMPQTQMLYQQLDFLNQRFQVPAVSEGRRVGGE